MNFSTGRSYGGKKELPILEETVVEISKIEKIEIKEIIETKETLSNKSDKVSDIFPIWWKITKKLLLSDI